MLFAVKIMTVLITGLFLEKKEYTENKPFTLDHGFRTCIYLKESLGWHFGTEVFIFDMETDDNVL